VSFDPPERLNIADHFLDARLREGAGDRVALRTAQGLMTYAEVQALANRFGHALRAIGVRREERVFLALADGPEFVGALFGALKIGAVAVMVNPHLEAERLTALFDYCRPGAAVIDAALLPTFESAVAVAAERPSFLVVGAEANTAAHAVFRPADLDASLETVTTHRDDPAIWLFSGGTTGVPKAVVQTHRSFANTTELYARAALGYGPDDITLSVPKLFFGYATGSNLFFPFSVGASAVLFPERPTAELLFELIREHRPTILINVPTMIGQMVAHPAAAEQDLSSLRFATSAGEALPAPLYERFKAIFGVELLDGLGTAEMWHIFVSNLPGAVKPGTLGRAVPGFDVRVRDESGEDLADGEVGQLWVRGGSRAIGYWRDLPRTEQAFRGEWFVGGDLVVRDADGWITYCGRSDDVLKVGGKWLAPQEVESCLMKHPAVAECAVVGVENADGLVKPYAFVVPATRTEDDLEAALKAHVLESLQPYKHPRRVIVVDALPRTHLGKIDRAELKRRAVESRAQRPTAGREPGPR
jgi:benzoate-CoA ligase family protein